MHSLKHVFITVAAFVATWGLMSSGFGLDRESSAVVAAPYAVLGLGLSLWHTKSKQVSQLGEASEGHNRLINGVSFAALYLFTLWGSDMIMDLSGIEWSKSHRLAIKYFLYGLGYSGFVLGNVSQVLLKTKQRSVGNA